MTVPNSAEYFVPQSQLSYARNVLQLQLYLTTISRPLFVGQTIGA